MSIVHNTDYATQMKDLLLQQFKGKPNWEALLGAWSISFQQVEDMLYDLFTKRAVDTAVGRQLDILGIIVGETRNGATDSGYRIRIKTRIIRNVSSGTGDSLLSAFNLLFAGVYTFTFFESYPAEASLEINNTSIYGNVPPGTQTDYLNVMNDLLPAGVGSNLVYHPTTATGMSQPYLTLFRFATNDSKSATSTTQGFGDLTLGFGGTPGGRFSGAIGSLA